MHYYRERTTNTTTQEMNIQGLKPGTEYEFRVIAVNQDGPSATPTVIRIRTKQEGKCIADIYGYCGIHVLKHSPD